MPPVSTFHNPELLWGLLLVPAILWWRLREGTRRASLRFSAAPTFSRRRGLRPFLMYLLPPVQALAVALVIIALARPQVADARRRDLSVEGIDIVIAQDLSLSMEAGDFRPNSRIYVAKQVLNEFISSRVNDRIGLVVFAGAAYTQAPLTLDYGVLKEVVKQLRTKVLEDGTAIGDAIAVSLNRLRESDAKSKVVILITDGDNNAGKVSPLDAAKMAKALKIPVYTILVGKGGRVPFPAGTDLFGNVAWREVEIPVNPALLREISSITGGQSYTATNRDELKAGLQKILDAMEKSKLMEGGATANYSEEFHGLLLWALVLAAAEYLVRLTLLRVLP